MYWGSILLRTEIWSLWKVFLTQKIWFSSTLCSITQDLNDFVLFSFWFCFYLKSFLIYLRREIALALKTLWALTCFLKLMISLYCFSIILWEALKLSSLRLADWIVFSMNSYCIFSVNNFLLSGYFKSLSCLIQFSFRDFSCSALDLVTLSLSWRSWLNLLRNSSSWEIFYFSVWTVVNLWIRFLCFSI
jgi:hypothetical protein